MELGCIVFVLFVFVAFGMAVNKAIASAEAHLRDQYRVYRQEVRRGDFVQQEGQGGLIAVREAYRRIAARLGGEFHDYAFQGMPKVTFRYKHARAMLTIYQAGTEPKTLFTQLTLLVPEGFDHRLEVYRQLFSDDEIRQKGIEDVLIGDAGFDPRYIIKTDSETYARSVLDARRREIVEGLRAMGAKDYLLISINPERMLVRKTPILASPEDLRFFVEMCCEFYDAVEALELAESGIELMDHKIDAPPVCQVCGCDIEGAAVACRRCRTPHHADCWDFNKKCSTFGCGETASVPA